MSYRVEVSRRARKYLLALSKKDGRLVGGRVQQLSEAPRPWGAKRLTGSLEGQYRLRVGDHRILYAVSDDARVVHVSHIGPRSSVYDDAERSR